MLYGRVKYKIGDKNVEEIYHAGQKKLVYHYEERVKVNNKAERVAEIIRFFNKDLDDPTVCIEHSKGNEYLILGWTELVHDFN